MWQFVGNGEPLVGIGAGPIEDAEFDARVTKYEAQFSAEQAGCVKASGLYAQTEKKSKAPLAPAVEE